MKNTLVISLMMLLCIGSIYLVSTSKVMGWSTAEGSKTYTSNDWKFSFSYPQNWITSSDYSWVNNIKASYEFFRAVSPNPVVDSDLSLIYGSTGVTVGVVPLGADQSTLSGEISKNNIDSFTFLSKDSMKINNVSGRIVVFTIVNNASNVKGRVYEFCAFIVDYPKLGRTTYVGVYFLTSKYDEGFALDILRTYQKIQ